MKLLIQIPSYNEEKHLPETLADLPESIPGIDQIEILVINDGSTDATVETALAHGVDYVTSNNTNRGLAQTFMNGINTSLALGADIIVNTDADHQYPGEYIAELVKPILEHRADIVIGDRQSLKNIHFSPLKRFLEAFGSRIVAMLSGVSVPDAASGFRAYTRQAASRLQVTNAFSYTIETLIQAGNDKMKIVHIPIHTNKETRPSRLHKGILNFIWIQSRIILRSYVLYKPLATFGSLSFVFMAFGLVLWARYLYFILTGVTGVARNIQSVTVGGVSILFGVLLLLLGLLGDAVSAVRNMNIEVLSRLKDNTTPENVKVIRGDPSRRKH